MIATATNAVPTTAEAAHDEDRRIGRAAYGELRRLATELKAAADEAGSG